MTDRKEHNEDVDNVLRWLQQPKVAMRVAALVVDLLDSVPVIEQLPRETYNEVSHVGALAFSMGYLEAMEGRDIPDDPFPLDDDGIDKPEGVAFTVTADTGDGNVAVCGQVVGAGSFAGLMKKIFASAAESITVEHKPPIRIISFSVIRGLPVQLVDGELK